jgi:hypothetical protein
VVVMFDDHHVQWVSCLTTRSMMLHQEYNKNATYGMAAKVYRRFILCISN